MNNQAKIIEFLYKNSESSYNINQIARLLGISVGSSFKILKELEKNQYIASKKENKSILYRIVQNSKAKEFYEHVEQEKNSKSRKRTKVICTLPKHADISFIRKLIDGGMDAARIDAANFNEKEAATLVTRIRSASESIPVILDVSQKDSYKKPWIKFALKNNVDFVSVSFVRNSEDIRKINRLFGYNDMQQVIGEKIKVLIKIEKDALSNYKEIVQESYGIMIDSDSLVPESRYETLPIFQKIIIEECNKQGKPAIIATKILESMINSHQPKKSEVSDIANAVLNGASCLMLSDETAKGKYPFEALETMCKVIKNVENESLGNKTLENNESSFIGDGIFGMGKGWNIDAMLTITSGGYSARMVSSRRLRYRTIAVTSSKKIFRQLNILWGIEPLFINSNLEDISDEQKKEAILKALKKGFIRKTDQIAIIASVFHSKSKRANLLEIHKVDEFLSYLENKKQIKNGNEINGEA